ncbi:TetR/AcrR family transcriptional regulator [Peptostreptococcus faecalis]|uniref:TetR/AcrR family transcriptional regulator n=1 Tax=Peptostreptococcus faecalis TaxID=2045015 RepID=UPI002E8E1278|nr:TetR/AcrR family transcriptional regulator C-terminal domain-containing protein [Peptostreptococcus faecalis]
MPNKDAKELIRKKFIEMLNQMPLKKITVKDIVSECNINRNTFYYHYSDVYDLLSEIFQIEFQNATKDYNKSLSWEEVFLAAVKFSLENKKAIYHIYYSIQREELERYIYNVAGHAMSQYVENKNKDINALEMDKEIIVSFYQCALTTMVIQWISNGMKEDPVVIIGRIGRLFNGHIEESLIRSANDRIY